MSQDIDTLQSTDPQIPPKDIRPISLSIFALFSLLALGLLLLVGVVMVSYMFSGDDLRESAKNSHIQYRPVPARWGNIYSSDGYLLASTVQRYNFEWDLAIVKNSTYNDTIIQGKQIKNISALCDSMAKYFPRRTAKEWRIYFDRARASGNRALMVAKDISQAERDLLLTFPIFKHYVDKNSPIRSGVKKIESYSKRITPLEGKADRLIGKAEDTKSYTGIEGYYASYLKGEDGERLMQQLRGEWKPLADVNRKDPVNGKDLVLTLDARMQDIAHTTLEQHMIKWKAHHGCAIVMDVKTGGIRAMANLTRDDKDSATYREMQNYAVGELADPGSTFKLMSFMAMLEENVLDTAQMIDTEGGVISIHGHRVRDYKAGGYGVLSAHKAFVKSSNTATVKLAWNNFKERPEDFMNRLRRMYLDEATGIDISGEPEPHIPTPGMGTWSAISMPWTSYGYEVRLTPLQTVSFYNAVANDGVYVEPHLLSQVRRGGEVLEDITPKVKGKVASEGTIKIAQSLLEAVVNERGGTAHTACYDPELRIAGKTGTAQYNYGRGERMQYMVSFAGYFPYDAPKYSIIVCMFRPQGYPISGGYIAAPAAKDIVRGIFNSTPHQVYSTDVNSALAVTVDGNHIKENKALPSSLAVMPDVRGRYVSDVLPALEEEGYTVKIEGGSGLITAQNPKRGIRLKKGQKIILTVK